MKKETLTPKTAKTFNEICELRRDNISSGNSWVQLLDGGFISISDRHKISGSIGTITLTKKQFEHLKK